MFRRASYCGDLRDAVDKKKKVKVKELMEALCGASKYLHAMFDCRWSRSSSAVLANRIRKVALYSRRFNLDASSEFKMMIFTINHVGPGWERKLRV